MRYFAFVEIWEKRRRESEASQWTPKKSSSLGLDPNTEHTTMIIAFHNWKCLSSQNPQEDEHKTNSGKMTSTAFKVRIHNAKLAIGVPFAYCTGLCTLEVREWLLDLNFRLLTLT